MSRRARARWGAVAAMVALSGCLSVPTAPACDDTHPCEGGRVCAATRCVEPEPADAASPRDSTEAPVDAARPEGDAAQSPPDGAPAAPDAAPDGATPAPDASPVVPDGAAPAPDAAPPPPDATTPDAGPLPDGELCNGLDDDGDGAVDEGFDLARDPDHCGACGEVCGRGHMNAVCRAGRCLPTGCQRGTYDANVDPADGCEAAGEVLPALYARPGAGVGDGTREHPFGTVGEALANTRNGGEVVLLPGDSPFVEAVELRPDRVWLHADPPGSATIESPDDRPAVQMGGWWSRVEGVTLRAPHAQAGLVLFGCAMEVRDVVIEDVHTSPAGAAEGAVAGLWIRDCESRVSDVRIEGIAGGGGGELAASGVEIAQAGRGATLVGIEISDVRAADAPARVFQTAGGAAYGVRALGASRVSIADARVSGLRGGTGSGDVALPLGRGGDGGRAVGVCVEATPDASPADLFVDGASIGDLTGGAAGTSALGAEGDQTVGADGGDAAALWLSHADDARISGLTTSARLLGGAGSPVSPDGGLALDSRNGRDGAATGVVVRDSQRFRCTASSIDGLSVGQGSDVDPPATRYGFSIDAASRRAVVDPSVRVHGDPVLYLDGGGAARIEGYDLVSPVPATNWGRIAIRDGAGVTVAGNTITNAGGPDPWFGGEVVGVFVGAGATNVLVEDNTFGPLVAGDAELPVVGVRVEANARDTVTLRGNRFHDLCGDCDRPGRNNPVAGVESARSLLAHHNLFARLHGEESMAYRLSEGVAVALISLETHVDFTARGRAAAVLVALGAAPETVSVRNSVFSGMPVALLRENPRPGEDLLLDHALVWGADAAAVDASVGADVILDQDPMLDADADYRPRPGSPAIDAGDPRTDCSAEPPGDPDGMCRVDLGHTGNTAAAQSVGGR